MVIENEVTDAVLKMVGGDLPPGRPEPLQRGRSQLPGVPLFLELQVSISHHIEQDGMSGPIGTQPRDVFAGATEESLRMGLRAQVLPVEKRDVDAIRRG
jgi:hypothetical protein